MTHLIRILIVVSLLQAFVGVTRAQECSLIVNFVEVEPGLYDVEIIADSDCNPENYRDIVWKSNKDGNTTEQFRFPIHAVVSPTSFAINEAREFLTTTGESLTLPSGTQVVQFGEDIFFALTEGAGGFIQGNIVNNAENAQTTTTPRFTIGDKIRIINTQNTPINRRAHIVVREGQFVPDESTVLGKDVVNGLIGTISQQENAPEYVQGLFGGYLFTWHYVEFDNGLSGWVPESYDRADYFELVSSDSMAIIPTPNRNETSLSFEIGNIVEVTTTDGDVLRCRSQPGTNSSLTRELNEGDRAIIVSGPVQNQGYSWWLLSDGLVGGSNSCWAADGDDEMDWLVKVETG